MKQHRNRTRRQGPAARRALSAAGRAEFRVPPGKLSWSCSLEHLDFKTTDDIELSGQIVGQRRAVDALRLGLEVGSSGYNIFVTGPVGTGRTTTVRRLLEVVADRPAQLDDKCYVNNFKDPDSPRLLRLAAGKGRELQREMDALVDFLVKNVPTLFESDTYQRRRQDIVDSFKEQGSARVREFERKTAAEGFALVQTAPFLRPELAPIVEKQPVKLDDLARLVEEGKLTAERAEEIRARYRELAEELSAIFKEIREFERLAREALQELDQNVVRPVLEERLADIAETQASGAPPGQRVDGLPEYLAEVQEAVIKSLDLFRQKPQDKGPTETPTDPYLDFRVNVLVDNTPPEDGPSTVPVVFETNPSFKNLFGSIDRVWERGGQWRADFSRIKAGSVLRADHGFLVVNAIDALTEPGVWPALKRTLRNRQLEISSGDPYSVLFGTTGLKPEPIAIDVKVIMVGAPEVYSILAAYDEDFKKVFKVRADFDWVMNLDRDAITEYVQVIKALCSKEKLRPFDRSGVKGVVEYGVRLAGRHTKVSTRFNIITELLTEANHWARVAGCATVGQAHVQEAINRRRDRVRLYEEKLQESINEGTVFIDVTGAAAGQVNGLAVYQTGEYAFGKPVRITARTGVGSAGIINIEREAQLSGPTHDKGVYILSGYLRHKYARNQPLVLSASICFEQSYGGIDGDSASSTEVYALLSDLSGLPIRQDLAVTGSVNQQGEIQPIGGVNWKIEGFFDTCKARGLTGTQGVVIPQTNLPELMLRPDVVEACTQGRFHVYAVSTVDEGIALLTGKSAGEPDARGIYPRDSVNGRVTRRLAELARRYARFRHDPPTIEGRG
ncbi:ATP-dependent protease [candidate division WOR-3 bacterium]|nr:ATP-dependent protease [candidate division WOR-3 bacterium]